MTGQAPAGASLAYQLKYKLLAPRTWSRRRRFGSDDPNDAGGVILEHFHYANGVLESFGRRMQEPEFMHTFDLDEDSVVIDVGGYRGEWSEPIWERYRCRIEVYEPAHKPLALLRDRFTDVPAVTVHEVGLGSSAFEATLADKGPGSTIYSGDEADPRSETIRIVDVIDELDRFGFDNVDLVKINIEGGEYDLLDRWLASPHGERVDEYLIQFHEWLPWAHVRRWKIRRTLAKTHELVWDYPWVFELWRRR